MKWLVFTGACVVVLVALGVLAVDASDVEWEVRDETTVALCPYCRADLNAFATVCGNCRRAVDWESRTQRCEACLAREDVELLKDRFNALAGGGEPLPGALATYPRAYFLDMEEGACTYCAGLGKIMEGDRESVCTVCRGDGRCIQCGGDRLFVCGDEGSWRLLQDRLALWRRADGRETLTRVRLKRDTLVNEDVAALRGYEEVAQLVDEQGRNLLDLARARIDAAFAALDAALPQSE